MKKITYIASLLILAACINISSSVHAIEDVELVIGTSGIESYKLKQPAGMGLRIAEHTVERFLSSMDDFFPTFFIADMKLPSSYH